MLPILAASKQHVMVSGGTNTCTTSSTTTRNKVGTGGTCLSKKFLTEVQALIAFASYDSRFITGGGASMTESMIERLMVQLCFGNEEEPDEEALCYVDQFLCGLNKFQGLYTATTPEQHPEAGGEVLLSMLPILHQQGSIQIFVGEGSIEKHLLLRKSLVNRSAIITGRTSLRLAKEAGAL